jgi:hypothetical protein
MNMEHSPSPYAWVKSRASASNGNCVELASLTGGGVAVRDSKDPHGPVLRYTAEEWAAFLDGAKSGEFDGLI